MPEYHVANGIAGIYAGTLNSRDKTMWKNKSLVTDEAICAVRDYMRDELKEGEKEIGFEWTLKRGGKVQLILKVIKEVTNDEE